MCSVRPSEENVASQPLFTLRAPGRAETEKGGRGQRSTRVNHQNDPKIKGERRKNEGKNSWRNIMLGDKNRDKGRGKRVS